MLCCRKTLIALALVMAIPVAVSAQTADKAPTPAGPAQPAGQIAISLKKFPVASALAVNRRGVPTPIGKLSY